MPIQKVFLEESEFIFETVMRVRNTEVSIGQYLTVESLASMLSEARSRFFYSKGIKEVDGNYQGLVVTDVSVNLPARVHAREELLVEVGVAYLDKEKASIHFKISRMYDGSAVGSAGVNVINFDYRHNQPVDMSPQLLEALEQKPFEI